MRKLLLIALIYLVGFILLGKLFIVQVLDDSYTLAAENNATKIVYEYPQRGYVYDRNGTLLVANQPSYDVMVTYRDLKPFDTLQLVNMLSITKERLLEKLEEARYRSSRKPYLIVPHLTKEDYASFQEKMHRFTGFYIQKRVLRDYQTINGANVLGFIGEVNDKEIEKDPYYKSGDLIGKDGMEYQYDSLLRGVKGVKRYQTDNFNRIIGPYKKGRFDTIPQRGSDITLTLDSKLQAYGEQLMVNKRGGIVAIEPSSGEILALVAAPNYDPALLVGRKRSKNFNRLYTDTISRPMFDRGLQGEYPPGSPFKTITGLIALQEGVVTPSDKFTCLPGYYYGRRRRFMGCHHAHHRTSLSMNRGVAKSCNAYFAQLYRNIMEKYESPEVAMDTWNKHVKSFGMGGFLGTDINKGRPGLIPNAKYYNRAHGKRRWAGITSISNSIGQGEVLMTPIQMANMAAAISNRGWFYRPHFIKAIDGEPIVIPEYTEKQVTTIDPEHFEPVIQGMYDVYNYGTASFLKVPGIEICGKTGTAENYTVINGERKQLTDHSLFVAFAPKDDPKIAIAVMVENGRWGARWAGRIASLMIEEYIKGEVSLKYVEDFVLNGSLQFEYDKVLQGTTDFEINGD